MYCVMGLYSVCELFLLCSRIALYYPGLGGIRQMMMTCEIFLSENNCLNIPTEIESCGISSRNVAFENLILD